MSAVRVADQMFDMLADAGVEHVFCLTGGGAMHLNDAVGHHPRIRAVFCLHEQAAAIAAETYAKIGERIGCCLVTTGPGGTNAITGVAGAWLDSTPLVVISGQVKRADLKGDSGVRQMGVQEVDIVSVVRPITKYAVTVLDPLRIREEVEKAVYVATSGRPGPVWVDVPLDVQGALVEADRLPAFDSTTFEVPNTSEWSDLEAEVSRAVEAFERAERPALLVGNGVRLAGARAELGEVVDLLDVPVLTSWLAHDLVPDTHPRFAGQPGSIAERGANFTLQNSDFLLAVGARLDVLTTGYNAPNFARGAHKVMVDIDAAELRKLGDTIQQPVRADAKAFLAAFARHARTRPKRDRSAWLARVGDWRRRYPVVLPEFRGLAKGVSTYHFAEALSEASASDDVIVCGSSGAAIEIFIVSFALKTGQRFALTTGLGAMGYGIAAPIGGALATSRRTIGIDGDGGFQLNVQELETLGRLQLPVKIFVLNNDGYASIRASQTRYFGRLAGADATSGVTLPDLRRVVEAYGLPYARIDGDRCLASQIRAVLESPGPRICEVMVPRDEPRQPAMASTRRPDGSMVSRPLEDLAPFLDRAEFRAQMIVPPLDD